MKRRYCLALDLKDDPQAIADYEAHHREVWPEVLDAIHSSGICSMEIYRVHTRLFMIMETDAHFSFEAKAAADASNPVVQQWEALMDCFQQRLPFAKPGEKWVLMDKIFSFEAPK